MKYKLVLVMTIMRGMVRPVNHVVVSYVILAHIISILIQLTINAKLVQQGVSQTFLNLIVCVDQDIIYLMVIAIHVIQISIQMVLGR